MLSIIWVSNAPWAASGYGVQTALVTPRLRDAGHKVTILSNYGLNGGRAEWMGMPVVPRGDTDVTTRTVIERYVKEFQADIVITHYDVWPFQADYGYAAGRWVPWLPIDREPLSAPIERNLHSAYWILPWCQHADDTIAKSGFKNRTIVPLCVDTDVYTNLDGIVDTEGNVISHEWLKVRNFGKPGRFSVGMVAANIDSRKNTHKVIRAIALLRDEIPEIQFTFHGWLASPAGIDVRQVLKQQNISDITAITAPERYHEGIKSAEMTAMYNCFDVLALPSAGEGWGLPLTEANACGVPAVFTNFTAMPEIAYGIGIDPITKQICREDSSYQAVVRDEDIAEAIYKLYDVWKHYPDRWQEMREEARQSALRFSVDKVVKEYWLPALKQIEDKIAAEGDVEKWLA